LLLTAALVLYLVGQLAVFYPARKAAAIAPATATRSV
jgi:ABC-type antimicrobial peptide transport system permease subunit